MAWLKIRLTIKRNNVPIFASSCYVENVTEYKEEIRKIKVLCNAMCAYHATTDLQLYVDRTWLVRSITLETALEMINALDIDVSRTALHYWRVCKKIPDNSNLKKMVDFLGVSIVIGEI